MIPIMFVAHFIMSYLWELFSLCQQDYYWFEKITVIFIMNVLQIHFWVTFLGQSYFLSYALSCLAGMPRRVLIIQMLSLIGTVATFGSYTSIIGLGIFFYVFTLAS
jgi:hypothetical protein